MSAPAPTRPTTPRPGPRDYRRNGVACLIAALVVAAVKVVGQMVERRHSAEFIDILDRVAEGIEPGTPVHAVLDSVASRKSAEVGERPKGRPDWTFHFTPAPAS